jgi:hypothetical protein
MCAECKQPLGARGPRRHDTNPAHAVHTRAVLHKEVSRIIGHKMADDTGKQAGKLLSRLKDEVCSTRGQRPCTEQKTVVLNFVIRVARQLGKRPGGRIMESRQVVRDHRREQRLRAAPEDRKALCRKKQTRGSIKGWRRVLRCHGA